MSLTVSDLGAEVGLSAATVRYYERLGLLPAPERSAAGYRQYHQDAVERLRFIKSAQRLGLRLREIAELLAICDQGLCPAGTARRCCAPAWPRSTPRWLSSKPSAASWHGRSSGIRPLPATTRPRPASGVRPPLRRRGGERHGVLVLRLPLRRVPVPVLRLPRPAVSTLGRR
jgi:DNA-binding transcriptional MerR regulator